MTTLPIAWQFIKDFWGYILILILSFLLLVCVIKLDMKEKEIVQFKTEHENNILKINNKNQETIIKLKDELITTNNKVTEVVNDYHTAVERQSERTKEIRTEVQTFIPSVVRESCDYGSIWLLNLNTYISDSNSDSVSRDSK